MRRMLRGSYTIEAVFIMPLVLGVIFLIMNLSFYMHDYNVLYQYTARISQKYVLDMKHSNEEISSQLISSDNAINNLLIADNVRVDVTVSKKKIKVVCNAVLDKPLGERINFWNKKNKEEIVIEKEVKRLYPVDFIRINRRIGD